MALKSTSGLCANSVEALPIAMSKQTVRISKFYSFIERTSFGAGFATHMFNVLSTRSRLDLLRHGDLARGLGRAAELAQRRAQRVMRLDVIGVKLYRLAQRLYCLLRVIQH